MLVANPGQGTSWSLNATANSTIRTKQCPSVKTSTSLNHHPFKAASSTSTTVTSVTLSPSIAGSKIISRNTRPVGDEDKSTSTSVLATASTSGSLVKNFQTISVRINRGTEFLRQTVQKAILSKLSSQISSNLAGGTLGNGGVATLTIPPTDFHRSPNHREFGSADSLNHEMCHFKPITAAPKTPIKRITAITIKTPAAKRLRLSGSVPHLSIGPKISKLLQLSPSQHSAFYPVNECTTLEKTSHSNLNKRKEQHAPEGNSHVAVVNVNNCKRPLFKNDIAVRPKRTRNSTINSDNNKNFTKEQPPTKRIRTNSPPLVSSLNKKRTLPGSSSTCLSRSTNSTINSPLKDNNHTNKKNINKINGIKLNGNINVKKPRKKYYVGKSSKRRRNRKSGSNNLKNSPTVQPETTVTAKAVAISRRQRNTRQNTLGEELKSNSVLIIDESISKSTRRQTRLKQQQQQQQQQKEEKKTEEILPMKQHFTRSSIRAINNNKVNNTNATTTSSDNKSYINNSRENSNKNPSSDNFVDVKSPRRTTRIRKTVKRTAY